MNTNFWWFKVDAKGVKEQSLVQLSPAIVEKTLAEYIINPDNRDNLENVPDSIKKIEKKTKNNIPGSNDWSDEKMAKFKEYLEQAFNNVMNSEVRDLVNTHMDSDEKLFKGLKVSGDTSKLKDLLDSSTARDWVGATLSLDKDIGAKQKELLNNERVWTSKEFFKNYTIKESKDKDDILIIIETSAETLKPIANKIYSKMFPHVKGITFEQSVDFGNKPMSTRRPNTSSLKQVSDELFGVNAQHGDAGWDRLEAKSPKTLVRYVDMFKNQYKVTGPTDKNRIADLERWAKKANLRDIDKKHWDNKIANQIIRFIDLAVKTKNPSKRLLLDRFNIKYEKKDEELFKNKLKYVKDLIQSGKLYEHLVKAHSSSGVGTQGGTNFSINNQSDYKITIRFSDDNKPKKTNSRYQLDSMIEETSKFKINTSALLTGKGTTWMVKPLIGMGRDLGASSAKDEKFARGGPIQSGGFNKARDYFIGQIKSSIKNLKNSASKIGVTLGA
jgi:hypothetical protein